MSENGIQPLNVALVIGSGAVKCAAALGLWKVLRREGIPIGLLVGCSGGSLFAAAMALGFGLEESVAATHRLWNRRITARRDLASIFRAILPGTLGFNERFGLMDDRALMGGLEAVFGDRTFAETRTPLQILATDFQSGEPITLTSGRLVDALRASIAIPYIWPPWQIGERLLIDGSLSNPMPVDAAILAGAGVILALGFEHPFPRRVKSISRFAFHVNSIMTNNLLKANYAFHNLAHHAEIITLLPEFGGEVSLFDTEQIPAVIEAGERAAEAHIPYLKRLLQAEVS